MFLLYKKQFAGKHTYGQYGQGALSRTRSPKNSHNYRLNIHLPLCELCPSANK